MTQLPSWSDGLYFLFGVLLNLLILGTRYIFLGLSLGLQKRNLNLVLAIISPCLLKYVPTESSRLENDVLFKEKSEYVMPNFVCKACYSSTTVLCGVNTRVLSLKYSPTRREKQFKVQTNSSEKMDPRAVENEAEIGKYSS